MLLYIDKVDFIMTSNSIGLLGQVPLRLGNSTINAIRSYSFFGRKRSKEIFHAITIVPSNTLLEDEFK